MTESILKPAILFIDDEDLSRKYFGRFFGKSREVLLAADGKEGLECYLANKERVGVVVSDQMMPEMTGLELLEELRGQGAPVVRMLSTAYTDSAEVEAATTSGLVEFFISKPWDLPELESVLEEAEALWKSKVASAA